MFHNHCRNIDEYGKEALSKLWLLDGEKNEDVQEVMQKFPQ